MKKDHKYNMYIISMMSFAVAYATSRNFFNLFTFLNYYIYIGFMNFFIIPLIIFTIFKLKKG